MMMEKMGQGIAGTSQLLNSGIEAYQKIKAGKQAADLGAINAAAALVGGHDKLPIETRNKLPGILDIELPRDEQGNVMLTPSAEAVLQRAEAEAAKSDPARYAAVKSGIQQPSRDPKEVELAQRNAAIQEEQNRLTREHNLAQERQTAANQAADRAEREASNIRTTEATRYAAELRGPSAASARSTHMQEKSDFWIETKTGNVLSRKAAEAQLKPGEHLEDGWTNPTHEALKEHSDARTAQARVTRSEKANEVDDYRKKLMKTRVQQAQAKDPQGTKFLQDIMRDSSIVLKTKDASAEAKKKAQDSLTWAQEQFAKKVGMEVPPEDHWWSIQPEYYNWALEVAQGLHEAVTGRGATDNALGATSTTTPSSTTTSTTAAPVKGGEVPGGKKTMSVNEWLGAK
jgi:hypothetical protein